MKKFALFGVSVGAAAVALLVSHEGRAADHLDSPATMANPMADIGDVYAWTQPDLSSVNLAMTVSPADDGTRSFDNTIQYAFHVTAHPGAAAADAFGKPGTEVNVICTFASNTNISCWVANETGVKDYVTGDPSTNGVASADGKLRVFAGRRSDPFFFNLAGFKLVAAAVEGAIQAGLILYNNAGCPQIDGISASNFRTTLSTASGSAVGPCAANQIDCFQNFNVMAIVVQVDPSLLGVDTGHPALSVWASTHATL